MQARTRDIEFSQPGTDHPDPKYPAQLGGIGFDKACNFMHTSDLNQISRAMVANLSVKSAIIE
jgi:hypothetical protein